MKKLILILLCFQAVSGSAQEEEAKRLWSVSAGYTYEPYIDGFVYVKEINTAADSLSFNQDLNVSRWHHVFVGVKKTFRSHSSLRFSAERFIYTSVARPGKNIYHNDLVLDGEGGISTSGSHIIRALIQYEDPVCRQDAPLRFSWSAGFMYDYIIFKIRGQIINDGDSVNFRENFNDQVIPSLILGGKLEWNFCHSSRSMLVFETFGAYIPSRLINRLTKAKFEYTAINGALGYRYDCGRFFIHPKIVGRHLHSRNDDDRHVFRTVNAGIQLETGINF